MLTSKLLSGWETLVVTKLQTFKVKTFLIIEKHTATFLLASKLHKAAHSREGARESEEAYPFMQVFPTSNCDRQKWVLWNQFGFSLVLSKSVKVWSWAEEEELSQQR